MAVTSLSVLGIPGPAFGGVAEEGAPEQAQAGRRRGGATGKARKRKLLLLKDDPLVDELIAQGVTPEDISSPLDVELAELLIKSEIETLQFRPDEEKLKKLQIRLRAFQKRRRDLEEEALILMDLI